MPSPPYAKILVSVNSAGNVSGGIDVPSAATIRLRGESVIGWLQQRWEFYEYPEGWATPAGWTLDADGRIYTNDVNPTDVTLPANTILWGPWGLRLLINEQVSDDQNRFETLIDESTALHMASPFGSRMVMALETTQFCTPTTKHKAWVRTLQRMIKIIDALIGTGGGILVSSNASGLAGNPHTSLDFQGRIAPAIDAGGGVARMVSKGADRVPRRSVAADDSFVAATDYHITCTATGKTLTLPGTRTDGDRYSLKGIYATTLAGGGKSIRSGALTVGVGAPAAASYVQQFDGETTVVQWNAAQDEWEIV